MATAGLPAVPATEPRTPPPYRAIGAGALSAAALLIITFAAIIGAEPTRHGLLLALSVLIMMLGSCGLWTISERRADARAAVARESTVTALEVIRQDLRDLGALAYRTSGAAKLDSLAVVQEQMLNRLDWLVVKRTEADAANEALIRRLVDVERKLAEWISPNVIQLDDVRDVVNLQRRRDEEQ